ncbi:hypothetical protein ABT084_02680 [Streptomyces sp. NPDC002138]|uniref:hypothetical protein n=1 Tax=Streptomyces sp. NPDC002138 TaxID=3154410 RepID=UPI003322AAA0
MAIEPDSTPIHNVYAERFAADLETNRKEQEHLSAQLTDLESRLKQLKADENWLSGMQGTLPPAADDSLDARAEAPVAVPQPRRAKKATGRTVGRKTARPGKAVEAGAASGPAAKTASPKTASPKAAAAKSAAAKTATPKATAAKATARKTATRKATTAAPRPTGTETTGTETTGTPTVETRAAQPRTGGPAEPPRRELVLALLVSAAEPRMVSEVTAELAEAHPGRPASTQVVRNTLEALAKKGLIEKENKQGSVMYSAPRPAAPETAPAAVSEAPVADTSEEKDPVAV